MVICLVFPRNNGRSQDREVHNASSPSNAIEVISALQVYVFSELSPRSIFYAVQEDVRSLQAYGVTPKKVLAYDAEFWKQLTFPSATKGAMCLPSLTNVSLSKSLIRARHSSCILADQAGVSFADYTFWRLGTRIRNDWVPRLPSDWQGGSLATCSRHVKRIMD